MSSTATNRVGQDPPPLRYSFWVGALTIRGSVSPRVFVDVLAFGLITSLIVAASHEAKRRFDIELSVPVGPFEAAGAVLGVLLVLRTNAGYDRWWEARKLWGGIVNQSRNLVVITLAGEPDELAWRGRLVRWAAVFPYVIRDQLRGRRELPEVRRILGDSEADWIAAAGHMPGRVASVLDRILRDGLNQGMPPMTYLQVQEQRAVLVDHLGACERILKTPLARSSAIQVRRFVLLFLLTLPFALLSDFSTEWPTLPFLDSKFGSSDWLVPLFVMLMAYPLLSLDRIGMELQNPFDPRRIDHLPLDDICLTIELNLMDLLKDSIEAAGVELPTLDGPHHPATRPEDPNYLAPHDPLDTLIS